METAEVLNATITETERVEKALALEKVTTASAHVSGLTAWTHLPFC